ncbi:hypothetical protein CYY_004000 [Polysphondylium violaceum]|uniref:Prespore-specific protein n=1 Tax=Polysphondylium violaceum TaxID=133409 RepID=A0A8J4UTE3_9MYCE|nr:hypothetical protein CYY_004000 [Polysphondylium violaceum]
MEAQLNVLSTDGKSWKKRYCSLKNRILYVFETKLKSDENSSNYQLFYFVPLARCGNIATAVSNGPCGKNFCFKISYELDESTHYWLSAENEKEMNQWVHVLQEACAVKKEPERVMVKGRSKSVVFKPGAIQIAGISDHSGWLKKFSSTGGFRKTIQWKKRWIVLKDLVLYVYEGPESKLKTKVSIPNWKISIDESIGGFCFTLSHIGYEGITLQAETAEERAKWIQRIKENNRTLTTTLPNEHDEHRIKEWIKSLTTLTIDQLMEYLTNASFLVNIIGKASSQNIRVVLEATDTRKQDDEWNRKSFEAILSTLGMQGIKFVQDYSADDFLSANPIILKFALDLLNHFNPLFMNTPPVSAVATPSVSACSTMTSPSTLTPRSEASSISSSSSSSVTKEQEEIDATVDIKKSQEKEHSPIKQPEIKPPSPKTPIKNPEPTIKPVEPEPIKPTTESVSQPTSPIKPTESVSQPTTPIEPIEPVSQPTSPIKPIEPVSQPTSPIKPVSVVSPIKPAPVPVLKQEPSFEDQTTEEILESITKLSESQNFNLDEEIANLSSSINLNASINNNLNTSVNLNTSLNLRESMNNNNNDNNDNHNNNNNITPISTPTKISPRYVSPYRNLKRVETKDVIGEFDRIFSSLGKAYPKCHRCNEPITGNDIIELSGKSWHLDHFNCCACHKPLMGMDKIPFVEREGKIYCKDDHDKHFKESSCSQCSKTLLITFAHYGKLFCKEHYMSIPEIQANICQNCEEPIGNAPYQILETKKWHVDHFKCSYCKVKLHDAAACSVKNSLPYCKKCHISLF